MCNSTGVGFRERKLGVENRRSDAVAGGGSGAVRWATDVLHLPPGIPGISHLSAVNKK